MPVPRAPWWMYIVAVHAAILAGQCAPIQSHVPQAAERWGAFFARSLVVDAARRPASAQEFLAECEKAFSW